ncbi:MAG: YkgJ family cysteine cluster protein [Lachnospiraceae bacterium]|nr:YkgJ family cysteine cluster protein [Lachnospiraceae bacterium]
MESLFKSENNTIGGKCSGCGGCCSDFLPLTDGEIKRIKTYMKEHGVGASRHLLPLSNAEIKYTCPFRDEVKRICRIYEVRPEICRVWICDTFQRPKFYARLMEEKRKKISMKEEFFGDRSNADIVENLKSIL